MYLGKFFVQTQSFFRGFLQLGHALTLRDGRVFTDDSPIIRGADVGLSVLWIPDSCLREVVACLGQAVGRPLGEIELPFGGSKVLDGYQLGLFRDSKRGHREMRLHRTYYGGSERGARSVSLVSIEKVAK